MPQSQTTGSKDGSVGQPETPTSSSPRHPSSIPGERVGEFRAPYPGQSSAAPPADFGFHEDPESDIRHASGQRGSKSSMLVLKLFPNRCSASTTTILPIHPPGGNAMAAHQYFSAVFNCGREPTVKYELLETVALYNKFCVW